MRDQYWPWDQQPNVAAVSSRRVVFGGAPVLLVVHYSDDHGWAFLDNAPFETSGGAVVSMREAVACDPTLGEVADLPPGFVATRVAVGAPWTRTADPDV